jgi:16S rRNA (adenine1518-N6/adenine1519-N6)-dimethyltransferase
VSAARRARRRRLGQHFLEPAWVEKVVRVIDPGPEERFLEVGAGLGALTRPLCERSAGVVAFEIDPELAAALRRPSRRNLVVVERDFLDVTAGEVLRLCPGDVRVAGNLPYSVASPILFKLVELYEAGIRFMDATLMLQREVADRLLARPGSRTYGVLSVMVGRWADATRLLNLPPGAFRPVPKVYSTVVRLAFHLPHARPRSEALFARLVTTLFTRRRKTLANALMALSGRMRDPSRALLLEALRHSGLDGGRRPETLDAAELVRLSDALAALPAEGRAVLL